MTLRQQQAFSNLAEQLVKIASRDNCDLIKTTLETWLTAHHYNLQNKSHFLHAFSSYLMQQVKNQKMQATTASQILNNIIVFSELDIPLSLYATNNALQLIVEDIQTTAKQSNDEAINDITKHVNHAKASMAHLYPASQGAEQCRYSGRFQSPEKKIVNK